MLIFCGVRVHQENLYCCKFTLRVCGGEDSSRELYWGNSSLIFCALKVRQRIFVLLAIHRRDSVVVKVHQESLYCGSPLLRFCAL